ncbi:unnamed protein product [Microthlaspi erraticum]|uniref:F-box domain-containing protein n=1 Tax=Microthlaspi erraticum TaxID=1685480 RepID=A0A6D2HHN7_9BRAS|nr:unnamed protein product [Microthlaspi erraticum]
MGRDRISELPNALLSQILLHLPSKESVKTSVLSKRWEYVWLKVPGLDLKFTDFPFWGEVFESFMDKLFKFNQGRMQKFKLKYEHIINTCSHRFVDWIATAVDRETQHLDVESEMAPCPRDIMPQNMYKSKTLVSLKLAHVALENPELVVSLPCLKTIHLEHVWYGWYNDQDGLLIVEKLISGCPVLEELTVVRSHDDEDTLPLLRVRSQSLQILHLMFDWGMLSTDFSVEIDAPRLGYLRFRDSQSEMSVVKNLSSLFKIDIDSEFNVKFGITALEPEDITKTKRDTIRDFLNGISIVRHMIISQATLEVLYLYSKLGPIPKFHNLYHLQAAFSSSILQLLPAFLESCPNLTNLILDFSVSTEAEQIDMTNTPPQCLTSTLECVEINKLIMKEETGVKLVNYFLRILQYSRNFL